MAEAFVEYDYKAQEPDELTIKKGDIITDISFKPGGWWEGTLKNGKRGMFPDNFVKLLKTEDGAVASSSGRKCKVLFSYKPENKDELELLPGDTIDIIGEVEEGWWKGTLRGRTGVFPSNFVAEVSEAKGVEREAALRKPKLTRDDSAKSVKGLSRSGGTSPDGPLAPVKPETSPTLPPKPPREYCRVLYKYSAANSDELSLKEGDVICIITKEGQDPGWWKGELRGKIGVFPDNFVEMISLEEANKNELKSKVTTRYGMSLSKSATTSAISETVSVNSLSRKFSDSSRSSEEKSAPPSVGKKPVLPPPPNKKPTSAVQSPPTSAVRPPPPAASDQSSQSQSSVSVGSRSSGGKPNSEQQQQQPPPTSRQQQWSSSREEQSDSTDGLIVSKHAAYSLISQRSHGENGVVGVSVGELTSSELNLDMVGRSSTKLVHPTASRAKAPKRRPPSGIYTLSKEDVKNGMEGGEEEEEDERVGDGGGEEGEGHEERTGGGGQDGGGGVLLNGTTQEETGSGGSTSHPLHHEMERKDKSPGSNHPPPWVEELKLNQLAKKSQQGKTRVMITSTSERSMVTAASVSSTTLSLSTSSLTEKHEKRLSTGEKVEKEEEIGGEVSRKSSCTVTSNTGQGSSSVVTLRGGGGGGGSTGGGGGGAAGAGGGTSSAAPPPRPHSMISSFTRTTGSDFISVPIKQWNELQDKVSSLESRLEREREELKAQLREVGRLLEEERRERLLLRADLEKLSDIVTQV